MAAKKGPTLIHPEDDPPRVIIPGAGYANLAERMKDGLVGQDSAVDEICPFLEIHKAGLCMAGKPAAIFLMLGPTGSGKTLTAERLAECLHGSKDNLLRIDCGEFQADHEVSKLIGSPPGYLGHKETVPIINQGKLSSITSIYSSLSIILLDEIEKAAPAMTRLLLGVLDKSTLKLGDNTSVNFDNTIIMMTSNLGAEEMKKEANPDFGFGSFTPTPAPAAGRMAVIGGNSAKRRFPPEFMNRIDCIITYKGLSKEDIEEILDIELLKIEDHIHNRLGSEAFALSMTGPARNLVIEMGFSKEYGARNLKRVLRKEVLFPLARLYNDDKIGGGDIAHFSLKDGKLDISVI